MYVALKDLPESLRRALSNNGYNKPDVELVTSETYTFSPRVAFEGNRGFITVVNLETGEQGTSVGSWGGANPFTKSIDDDDSSRAMLPNMVVVKGESGGRGTFARLYTAPGSLARLLPAPQVDITEAQGVVLHCLKAYKSSYRRGEAQSYGIEAAIYDATLKELADKGLAKLSSNGAAQITTNGKNVLSVFKLPKRKGW